MRTLVSVAALVAAVTFALPIDSADARGAGMGGGGFHGGGGGFHSGGGGFHGGPGGFQGGSRVGVGPQGGGFASGFHGGGHNGNWGWHGGGGHDGHFHNHSDVGLFFGWPYAGWPYSYPYYDYGYYPPTDYRVYAYDAPPAPPPPVVPNWYYCDNPQGYYPYVQSCGSAWQDVPATPQP